MSGETLLGPPWVSKGGVQGHTATSNLKKHNMPLESALFRPSSSFINHRHRRGGPERGWSRQCGAWETPCSGPKNEALIKPLTTTSQHLTPSTQLDYTQVNRQLIIYQRYVHG